MQLRNRIRALERVTEDLVHRWLNSLTDKELVALIEASSTRDLLHTVESWMERSLTGKSKADETNIGLEKSKQR